MKNKKGFTLVELLAILVILGTIAAIAVFNISKQAEINEENEQSILEQKVQNAAKMYAAKYYASDIISGNDIKFTLNDLIEDGLLNLGNSECTKKRKDIITFNNGEISDADDKLTDDDCFNSSSTSDENSSESSSSTDNPDDGETNTSDPIIETNQ